MPDPRKKFLNALLAVFLSGALAAFAADGSEGWPFVAYNMYARISPAHARTYLFEARGDAGMPWPFPDSCFRPYLRQDFVSMLNGRFPHESEGNLLLFHVLQQCATELPRPVTARIYRLTWSGPPESEPRIEVVGEEKWQ